MSTLLYVTSSSYSGSTLLSFLLNTHDEVFTVGEMDGWNYRENEIFLCSCGVPLKECKFFSQIKNTFDDHNIEFDYRNFGTGYNLIQKGRLNNYLTAGLPGMIESKRLERIRDYMVYHVPYFKRKFKKIDRANTLFIKSSLDYSGAKVFVDTCKSPYWLRHKNRLVDFDLKIIYLIRDLRGVVFSNLELHKKGWTAKTATKYWIREQSNILKIVNEFPSHLKIYYEDLCDDVDKTLEKIYAYVDLKPTPYPGDFKQSEHHILGNHMRLKNTSKIIKNTRWQKELEPSDLNTINLTVKEYLKYNPNNPESNLLRHYID